MNTRISPLRRLVKRLIRSAAVLAVVSFVLVLIADRHVATAARGRIFASAAECPHRTCALVLGTDPLGPRGGANLFYQRRIAAAAALFRAGKVDYLLVSGDNSRKDYDEPTAMKADLILLGVPKDRIRRDFAGFRTLDSVVRAKEVFGLESVIIVSQRDHDERAIYLARESGLDAIAVAAEDVPGALGAKVRAREAVARAAAVADMKVLGRRPRFLGERIAIDGPPEAD